jgi:hypothetical protein
MRRIQVDLFSIFLRFLQECKATLQVGHIERNVAACVAPLMDKGVVRTDVLITRNDNRYEIGCELHLYGRPASIVEVARTCGRLFNAEVCFER